MLEEKDFIFETGGPLYFSFTECDKVDGSGYAVYYKASKEKEAPQGTCLFPSELEPWELNTDNGVNPQITSEQTVCIFEVGFDDKNVFTGDIRKTEGGSWGTTLNGKMAEFESPLDCFSSDISSISTETWEDAVIIGLW